MQLYFEFNSISKKIYRNNKNLIRLIFLLLVLIFLSITIIFIFVTFNFQSSENKLVFIYIITTCVLSDIGGYIFGKTFKGKKLSKISPNKTYSGMIGSYILSLVLGYLIFYNKLFIDHFIILTIIISTINQFGDLFISFLKRKAKIKDTGKILPGHGGLLDRLDGIIFALPIGSLLINIS